jgi:RimJ/RimL family protein N-acetyltransferase
MRLKPKHLDGVLGQRAACDLAFSELRSFDMIESLTDEQQLVRAMQRGILSAEHNYRIMPRPQLYDGELLLRAVRPQDIESIRQWRNAQIDVLRQSEPITPEAQQRYFEENVWPDKDDPYPKQILLAIEHNGQLRGYGGLVHISWPYRRAEISFLLEPQLEQNSARLWDYFSRYLVLIQDLAFNDLQLNRLTTETYENRVLHIQALEAAGHCLEGRLRAHVIVGGKPLDALIHSILKQEWRSSNRSGKVQP